VAAPVASVDDLGENFEEGEAIRIVFRDGVFSIAPGGDVIEGTGEFYSERSSHEGQIAELNSKFKT
jgi:hypothetical protein